MGTRELKIRLGADLSEFEKAMVKAAKVTERFGKDLKAVGENLTKVLTVPLAGLGAAAVTASEQIDEAMDRIRTGTGATGDALDSLGSSFKSVFRSVPADAATVSTAIADLNTRTGLTGEALESLSTQMIQLAQISGGEVGPLIAQTTTLFKNWQVSTDEQATALDTLWKVSQETGVGVGSLADTLSQGGATLRALGLDFDSAAATVGQFAKIGIDAGGAMGALTKAATELSKKGGDVKENFLEAVNAIKSAEDPAKAAAMAVELFGKQGVAMADAIRRGGFDVQGFADKLRASKETIAGAAADTAGLGEAFQKLKNNVALALQPIGDAVTRVLIKLLDVMTDVAKSLQPVTQLFAELPEGVQNAVVAFGMFAAALGPAAIAVGAASVALAQLTTSIITLKATGAALLPQLAGLFTGIGSAATASGTATSAGTSIAAGAVGALGSAAGLLGRALAALTGPVGIAVGALALLAANWDKVKAVSRFVVDGLIGVWNDAKSKIVALVSGITSVIKDALAPIATALSDIGSKILASAKDIGFKVWEFVKGPIDQLQAFASDAWQKLSAGASAAVGKVKGAMQAAVNEVSQKMDMIRQKMSPSNPSDFFDRKGLASRGFTTMAPGVEVTGKGQWALNDRGEWVPWSPGSREGSTARTAEMIPGGRQGGVRDIIIGGQSTGGFDSGARVVDFLSDGKWSSMGPDRQDVGIRVPMLAEGGIVTGPTFAMIGEAGPEAVVPLRKMGSMGGGSPIVINVIVSGSVATRRDIAEQVHQELLRKQDRNRDLGWRSS